MKIRLKQEKAYIYIGGTKALSFYYGSRKTPMLLKKIRNVNVELVPYRDNLEWTTTTLLEKDYYELEEIKRLVVSGKWNKPIGASFFMDLI
ncbi:MAG: hypothetical protein J6I84_03225 [Bacilli bacterium]|nr:hypothetical protein [Bacilli bacterium]